MWFFLVISRHQKIGVGRDWHYIFMAKRERNPGSSGGTKILVKGSKNIFSLLAFNMNTKALVKWKQRIKDNMNVMIYDFMIETEQILRE